ncbi:MAG: hypothetical protein JJ992_20300, partial [Planctomycetes bacterium]|nr:hypothetical protein [Planctomycetota bacterium]
MLYNRSPVSEATLSAADRVFRRPWRRLSGDGELSGCIISFLLHLFLLLGLAYFNLWPDREPGGVAILVPPANRESLPMLLPGFTASVDPPPGAPDERIGSFDQAIIQPAVPEISLTMVPTGAAPSLESTRPPRRFQPQDLLMAVRNGARGGGYEGRDPDSRARMVRIRGGTPASEDAVSRGLAWLAAHQRPDGSWRFDHRDGPCGGLCANPGTVASTTASTGLALLPFLGAGETAEDSQYGEAVKRGLYYLTGRIIMGRHGGDLQEGTMYAQGIASIALCEAYAMTR